MIEPKTNLKSKALAVTPIGRFNFPYLAKPDEKFATDRVPAKYKTSLLVTKEDFKEKGKDLQKVILDFAREFYQAPTANLKDFKEKGIRLPFVDCDTKEKVREYEKGCIELRAETTFNTFKMVGPDKKILSREEVEKIKSGDYGRLIVQPYGHIKSPLAPSGIKFYLQIVQFAKVGEAYTDDLGLLDRIEQELPAGYSLASIDALDDIEF